MIQAELTFLSCTYLGECAFIKIKAYYFCPLFLLASDLQYPFLFQMHCSEASYV